MRLRAAVVLTVASSFLLGGCDSLLTPSRPDEVRVMVDGEASSVVELVTSHDFLVGASGAEPGSEVHLVQADTSMTGLPFERTYDLAPTFRFAVRVAVPSGETGDVRLQVFLDGTQVWNEGAVIEDSRRLQFYMVRHW